MPHNARVPTLLPTLLASDRAPSPRTLVDIFREVVDFAPQSPAVDSGVAVLTYAELAEAATQVAAELHEVGVRTGDKVGVRIKSGTTDLYVAILGILFAGAAYVPVDADDPDERARVVFEESEAVAVIGNDLRIEPRSAVEVPTSADLETAVGPTIDDDAWVIFTSGSTGKPKGVAVTHRNAAAFVDAESRMFLVDEPIGPGDRVMAGLSVAFDASCEEMWLAWAYGACLVPAPRSLVRSGVDVGPWLVANAITVVSTVPTLVALWPPASLDKVRLLIMGGEACPPELAQRLQRQGREVWNTYGPTEATVVACGALLDGTDPVRIGLPLDGWDLAVVDAEGNPVAEGASGELIIGGVGLARYLDPEQDAAKYAPMPTLGWQRAYRSGDVVRNDPLGLVFAGRADDQIKLGGRRIELGEIDEQLLRLPGVNQAAAAVRSTKSGNKLLVGYLTVDSTYDGPTAQELLRGRLPAALVPRLATVDTLPTRTSGKVDRDALPWPLPKTAPTAARLSETQQWLAGIWADVLGADVTAPRDDFFDFGGGSLTAAQVVSRIRERYPEIVVGDVYAHPTIAGLADVLPALVSSQAAGNRDVRPLPLKSQIGQLLALVPLRALAGMRWLSWLLLGSAIARPLLGLDWLPTTPVWVLVLTTWFFLVPPGRMTLAALLARAVLRPLTPGEHPRGGKIHLRIWLAERIQDELAATSLAGAPWFPFYARLLGNDIGKGSDLHTLPPVTGMLTLGRGAAVEPEVDLAGHWIDGDVIHVGPIEVGARARVGARCTLSPGACVGKDAEVAPGSLVEGVVPAGEFWAGSPAERRRAEARGPWQEAPTGRTASTEQAWLGLYGAMAALIAALPAFAVLLGTLVLLPVVRRRARAGRRGSSCAAVDPACGARRLRRADRADLGTGPGSRRRHGSRVPPGPVRHRRADLEHPARPRRGSDLAVPAVCQRADAGVAADAGRPHRPRRRGLDGAAHPEVHHRRGGRVPRGRHPGRLLRAGRRLDPGRPGEDRQARLRRQLRHGRAGAQGPQGVAGRGALSGTRAHGGQGRFELGGQPTDPPAAYGRRDRRHPHVRAADPAQGRARPRRGPPGRPVAPPRRAQPRGRRRRCSPWRHGTRCSPYSSPARS